MERTGRALILASFLSAVGFTSVFSLLPLYMRELAEPGPTAAFWAGIAMAATPLGGALAAPVWGRLADRFGYRPMLLRALISTSLITILMALPDAPWQLVMLRALAGALGSFQPMAMGALTSWSKPEDLSRAISRLQMAQVGGAIVGPLIGGIVAAFAAVRLAPVAGGLAIAVGVVLVARWFHEPKSRRSQLRGAGVPLRPWMLWLPMITLVAVQFTDASFNPILPLLLAQGGGDVATVAALTGLAASFNATAAAVASGLAGRGLQQEVKHHTMVAAALMLGVLAMAAVAAPAPWGVVAIRILCGGVVAAVAVAAFSMGGLMVLPGQRGSAYGWLTSSNQIGYASSPIVTGALAAIDLRAVLVVDALLCLMVAAGWGASRLAAATPTPDRPAVSGAEAGQEGPAAVEAEEGT
ncbi:MAG: MFS transporter [Chloroflexota bacterium]